MWDLLNITEPGDKMWVLIVVLAIVTYLTRIGGHIVLSRFKTIHPRIEAALDAVPAAVMTTLVVPPALTNGLAVFIALAIAVIACFRLSPLPVIGLGIGVLIILRQAGM